MLPATLAQGSSVSRWNMKPTPGGGPAIVCPATTTRPPETGRSPETSFSTVDLPQPLGPTSDTNSPGRTCNSSESITRLGGRPDAS